MKIISKIYVSVFGLGFSSIGPGTLGSLFTLLTWYFSILYHPYIFYILFLLISISSYFFISNYLKYVNADDPSEVIIDEYIGQSIPLLFIYNFNLIEVLIAFFAFRFFDIFKIYPVNKADNLKGAWGVILDDVIAGLYALIFVLLFKVSETLV